MNKIYVVGLTGPTGAGKSAVAGQLREAGMEIVDADEISRQITIPGSAILNELIMAFGEEILCPDGTLNRRKLASIAFRSEEKTQMLGNVTHPHIVIAIRKIVRQMSLNRKKVAVVDAPLLFESNVDRMCDLNACVVAPPEVCRARILKRDRLTEEQCEARMSVAKPVEFYTSRADYVIENNNNNSNELAKKVRIFESVIWRAAKEARR